MTDHSPTLKTTWYEDQQRLLEQLIGAPAVGRLFSAVTDWRQLDDEFIKIMPATHRLKAAIYLERIHGAKLSGTQRESLFDIASQAARSYGEAKGLFSELDVITDCLTLLDGNDRAPTEVYPRNTFSWIPFYDRRGHLQRLQMPLATDAALLKYLDLRINMPVLRIHQKPAAMLPLVRREAGLLLGTYLNNRHDCIDGKGMVLEKLCAAALLEVEPPAPLATEPTRAVTHDNVTYLDFSKCGPR